MQAGSVVHLPDFYLSKFIDMLAGKSSHLAATVRSLPLSRLQLLRESRELLLWEAACVAPMGLFFPSLFAIAPQIRRYVYAEGSSSDMYC